MLINAPIFVAETPDYGQSGKVAEEFAEYFAEACAFRKGRGDKTRLEDEMADLLQAVVNDAYVLGVDLQAALDRCYDRNRERGRI